MSEAGTCPSMTYPPTSVVWQEESFAGRPFWILTGETSGMLVTAAVKPLACMYSTHFVQQPQVGLLKTFRCGLAGAALVWA